MQSQNQFDKFISDFLQSKTFKALILLASISCLLVAAVAVLMKEGLINLSSVSINLSPATNTPLATSDPWRWVSLNEYEIYIKIPNDWTVHEIARPVDRNYGYGPGRDYCSDVLISSHDENDVLSLSAICSGTDTNFNPCPSYDFVNYGEGIVRVPAEGKNTFAYTIFKLYNGTCLNPPWWTVGDMDSGLVFFIIEYGEFDKAREEIWDFSIPDEIVQSIHK